MQYGKSDSSTGTVNVVTITGGGFTGEVRTRNGDVLIRETLDYPFTYAGYDVKDASAAMVMASANGFTKW